MANLNEIVQYDSGIYQIETTDPVLGGPNGITNVPLKSLANRTSYLKKHVDDLESGVTIPPGIATQTWVGDEIKKLDGKKRVLAATTSNIVLSGNQSIDGVALVNGDRVLVKNQTAAATNGIYVVATGAWGRAADADSGSKLNAGVMIAVESGAVNGGSLWMLNAPGAITVGNTAVNFQLVMASNVFELPEVPAYKISPVIIVTQPHLRVMVWNGSQYVRAPWHQPCQLFFSYDNPASISGALPVRADVSYSQANYPDVVARLGLSGVGTFSLVEARGEFIRVLDNGLSIDPGRVLRSFQSEDIKSHRHLNGFMDESYASGTSSHVYGESSDDLPGLAEGRANTDTGGLSNGRQGYTSFTGGLETRPRNIAFPLWMTI